MRNRTNRPKSRDNNAYSGHKKSSFNSSNSRNRSDKSGGQRSHRSHGSRGSQVSHGSHGRRGGFKRGGRKMPSFDPSQFINKNPVDVIKEVYEAKNTFETFGLDARLVKNITKMGISIPTPIQDQIIPEIMNGRDVLGIAETGTGKTAAFLVPIVNKILKNNRETTLVLVPTRELALQIQNELRQIAENLSIYSTVTVGGMPIGPQIRMLKKTNQLIIGTPGRTLDLFKRKIIRAEQIKAVVLDEADRMLDMGFLNDMKEILSMIPNDINTLLFSATIDKRTEGLISDFLKNPAIISVKKKDTTDSIEQDVVNYIHNKKFDTLVELLSMPDFKRVIIFGSMKHSVEKLSENLHEVGIKSESIHGNKNHRQRQNALLKFKNGEVQVLVATDVAARGIHVENVSHVINYDLPNTKEDYIHRIGRTGRGKNSGKALTFVEKHLSH